MDHDDVERETSSAQADEPVGEAPGLADCAAELPPPQVTEAFLASLPKGARLREVRFPTIGTLRFDEHGNMIHIKP